MYDEKPKKVSLNNIVNDESCVGQNRFIWTALLSCFIYRPLTSLRYLVMTAAVTGVFFAPAGFYFFKPLFKPESIANLTNWGFIGSLVGGAVVFFVMCIFVVILFFEKKPAFLSKKQYFYLFKKLNSKETEYILQSMKKNDVALSVGSIFEFHIEITFQKICKFFEKNFPFLFDDSSPIKNGREAEEIYKEFEEKVMKQISNSKRVKTKTL